MELPILLYGSAPCELIRLVGGKHGDRHRGTHRFTDTIVQSPLLCDFGFIAQ
jgi:hypothetical protein